MLIVTKYEEIYPPLLKDFAYISENNCDAEMILEMEKKILFALDFDIEFFTAFDRRELDKGNYVFPYDEEKTIKLIGRPLSQGEIACATSHLLLLKHALEKGYNEIVVMEDDIRPTAHTSIKSMEYKKILLGG